jgi:hypothetical protein
MSARVWGDPVMALESIHACDCANGFTYVGEISIHKSTGMGGVVANEEVAVSHYFVIETKMLMDRTWKKEIGEDHKEHFRYVPFSKVASTLYCIVREQGTLNRKMVKLPGITANHELES